MDEACPSAPNQNRVRRMDLDVGPTITWRARLLGRGTKHPKSGRCPAIRAHVPLAWDKQFQEYQHHEHSMASRVGPSGSEFSLASLRSRAPSAFRRGALHITGLHSPRGNVRCHGDLLRHLDDENLTPEETALTRIRSRHSEGAS
jgi:hypothetical protein